MRIVRTEITISAPPQTVWSILDDLDRYGEWNRVLPRAAGFTTAGRRLDASIRFSNGVSHEFGPLLLRVVGARELRWVSEVPGEEVTRAEHYFILTPTADGGTHLEHCESFTGPLEDAMWPLMEQAGRADYIALNEALKARAEAAVAAPEAAALHPALPLARDRASPGAVGVLRCRCLQDTVEVHVDAPAVHSHLCGCTQCWKPEGALFALTAVVPADAVKTVAHGEKLAVVDASKAIRRHACKACGTHMHGEVCDTDHHFFGLAFIHPELGSGTSPAPEFAGFVSSIIESGVSPTRMVGIRRALGDQGIAACDAFSPEIMDLIAWHRIKLAREARA